MNLATNFLIAFIPIFVAMDAVGVLPFYVSIVEGLEKENRKKILYQAVITAGIVGILFIFLGKIVFNILGVTVADFKVAGGLILLVLSTNDLLFADKKRRQPNETPGAVPLGMPLIVGPAVLTALIVQVDHVGITTTVMAFAVNLIITFLIFASAGPIVKTLRKSGTQAVSKLANLLLAAIAVMTIRMGIIEIVQSIP